MKINIVFPYNTWSGAFRSTYELANHMAARGEDVQIYVPFFPYLNGSSFFSRDGMELFFRGVARSVIRRNRIPWFDLKVPLTMVPLISDFFIRDADVIMANHWPTVPSVAKLSAKKGRKFNFIRDTKYFPLELDTFRLPLSRIVVSSWLKEFLNKQVGVEVAGVVSNGTNMALFEVKDKTYNTPPTVCMMFYDHPIKGMPHGFEALKRVKERHPEVKILMFGWKKPKHLPFEAEFHQRPVKDKLRAIYARSDIYLFTSLQEGSGNTPREAMAAGCAVVSTNVGCIPDCAIPGETALVVEPGDVDGMVESICSLIENPDRTRKMGRQAQQHIQQFTWEKATTQLLELLRS